MARYRKVGSGIVLGVFLLAFTALAVFGAVTGRESALWAGVAVASVVTVMSVAALAAELRDQRALYAAAVKYPGALTAYVFPQGTWLVPRVLVATSDRVRIVGGPRAETVSELLWSEVASVSVTETQLTPSTQWNVVVISTASGPTWRLTVEDFRDSFHIQDELEARRRAAVANSQ